MREVIQQAGENDILCTLHQLLSGLKIAKMSCAGYSTYERIKCIEA
jgi:hypothetical protein